jgi:hypothetical protein
LFVDDVDFNIDEARAYDLACVANEYFDDDGDDDD